jgi:hypothetical protein
MSRITEHEEFLLSRLLDGDLPADQASVLRERIEREPTLSRAWQKLRRINDLLIQRRSDTWDLDVHEFHVQVMDRLAAEPIPAARVLRFPRWLRVAMPLAAAAAVAIAFIVWTPPEADQQSPAGPGSLTIAYHTPASPAPAKAGTLIVRYHRPGDTTTPQAQPVHVAYARSSELEDYYRRTDEARRNQPSSHLYIMHAESDTPAPPGPMEAPPL